MTVDRTFVLGSDDLCTEWGYTALSRHRDEARFYVVDPDLGRTLPLDRGPDDPAVEQRLLDRSRAKELASEIADRATEPVSEIEAPPLISPERTLELTREYRARVAATERVTAELAKTEEMQRDADRQLAAAEIERQETSIFDRSSRQSLDRTIAASRQSAEYWQLQHDDREQQFNEVDAQRSEWLEQHRPEIEALLPADGRSDVGPPTLDELHDELLDRGAAAPPAPELKPPEPSPLEIEIAEPPLISPERTLELAREYRARVAATERARAELAKTEEMQRDADRRLAAAEIERQETSIFDRSRRQWLDRTIPGHRQAVEYWQLQHDDREQQLGEVETQRSEWLEQHRPEIEALLPADARSDVGPPTLDDLHDELLDRGAAAQPAPELEPPELPPPALDLPDMDLGP